MPAANELSLRGPISNPSVPSLAPGEFVVFGGSNPSVPSRPRPDSWAERRERWREDRREARRGVAGRWQLAGRVAGLGCLVAFLSTGSPVFAVLAISLVAGAIILHDENKPVCAPKQPQTVDSAFCPYNAPESAPEDPLTPYERVLAVLRAEHAAGILDSPAFIDCIDRVEQISEHAALIVPVRWHRAGTIPVPPLDSNPSDPVESLRRSAANIRRYK